MQTLPLIRVRGLKPVPWGSGNNEWLWRKALANQGRLVRAGMRLPPILPSAHFAVEIIFYMTVVRIQRADLDNLAKPVLDTLFRTPRPQVPDLSLTGAVFEMDDSSVFRLVLEKRLVAADKDEGADISISWS